MNNPIHISIIIQQMNVFEKESKPLVFKRLRTKKAVKFGDFTA